MNIPMESRRVHHRTRQAMAVAAIMAVAGTLLLARPQESQNEPVELSAVVLDDRDMPVRGLVEADFQVKENGRPVMVTGFNSVATDASATRGRSIVLILGAAGTDPALTTRVQRIANAVMKRAGTGDQVSVVRYSKPKEEIAGDRQEMSMRIAEYRAITGAPLNAKTSQDVLDLVARISSDLARTEPRRHAIVAIGSPGVFDVIEPPQKSYELNWPYWVKALTAAGRANASLYLIDPLGLTGRVRINPDGLIAQTGGTIFDNLNEFEKAIDRIWAETGSYYRLEYLPAGDKREVQTIDVKVSRPGVKVRARRSR